MNMNKKLCSRTLIGPNPSNIKVKKSSFEEKSLAEIGFNSNEIDDWNKIAQPNKTDLQILLDRMVKNSEKTNVQIKISTQTFRCHMMVLQCYSDFFSEFCNEKFVILPEDKVSPQSFAKIYNWMLSSNPMIKREGIVELFTAAQFLKIKSLVDQCWICLDDDERFCEDAAFLLYLEARKFDQKTVEDLMLLRISRFFLTLVASKDFLELTANEICTLLGSNRIGINSETEVLMSVVRWISYDWNKREKYVLDLMKCIRFGLMTPWQLLELKRNTDSDELQRVLDYSEVKKMIDDGLSFVTTKYWYDTESISHYMELYNLTEPAERQWIKDKLWSNKFQCPNKYYTSYKSFLEYLEMIQNMGTDHWKSLELTEEGPNSVLWKNFRVNGGHGDH